MVVLDKYSDADQIIDIDSSFSDHGSDAPPSYETIAAASRGGQASSTSTGAHVVVDEKSYPRRHSTTFPPSSTVSLSAPRPGPSQPKQSNSSWRSMLSFTSSRPSEQVRQTMLILLQDLVLNPDSPDLLSSCKDACRTYNLNLSALLQEPYIEKHSPIYWAIVNKREGIIESMVAHAIPLSQATASEVRLACLATSNQELFQALRTQRGPFATQKAPLSSSSGADSLVLGSIPADELSIHEREGEGAFVVDMKFNLWQKRMRVSGRVTAEFIARGRIWSLTFFSAPPTRRSTMGWQVALCLLEHSPPTFIDSRLVVDLPLQPSISQSQPNDLISLSPSPEELSGLTSGRSPASSSPSSSLWLPMSNRSTSKSQLKAPKRIDVRIKDSLHQLAYDSSHEFLSALHHATSCPDAPWPPKEVTWYGERYYTNAIVVPLEEDAGRGAELMYDNTPFIGADGTLHIRLEARLGKPQGTDCIIC